LVEPGSTFGAGVTLTADRPVVWNELLAEAEPAGKGRDSRVRDRLMRRVLSEGFIVFALAFVSYLIVAVLLDYKYDVVTGDATSRMANAFYVLYSRDPHVAAVGFIWNPLPSFIDLFFLLFKDLWPALSSRVLSRRMLSSTISFFGTARSSIRRTTWLENLT